jgi:hypothetical protein
MIWKEKRKEKNIKVYYPCGTTRPGYWIAKAIK